MQIEHVITGLLYNKAGNETGVYFIAVNKHISINYNGHSDDGHGYSQHASITAPLSARSPTCPLPLFQDHGSHIEGLRESSHIIDPGFSRPAPHCCGAHIATATGQIRCHSRCRRRWNGPQPVGMRSSRRSSRQALGVATSTTISPHIARRNKDPA